MAKMTKRDLVLLKKLQKANLYPGLQEKMAGEIKRNGVQGVNAKSLDKFLNSSNIPKRPRQAQNQMMNRREETPAGFGIPWQEIATVAAPAVTKGVWELGKAGLNKFSNWWNGRENDKVLDAEEANNIQSGMSPQEAAAIKARKQKEWREGIEAQIEAFPKETPEDLEYRYNLRDELHPYLMRNLQESERTPRTALRDLEKVLGQFTSGVTGIGKGAGRLVSNTNKFIGQALGNNPYQNNSQINSLMNQRTPSRINREQRGAERGAFNYLNNQAGVSLEDILNNGLKSNYNAPVNYNNLPNNFLNSLRNR